MSVPVVFLLVTVNLAILFLLLAAPLGARSVRRSVVVRADAERVWAALWPLGEQAGWSGEILSADAQADGRIATRISWSGRDGQPIERFLTPVDVRLHERFTLTISEDSSLDPSFWANYSETVELQSAGQGTRVTVTRTDRYRGLAFLIFRWFALRRSMIKFDIWAETGTYRPGGLFEHPLTQVGLGVLSAAILWPFFGLDRQGLLLAGVLTLVVALHEMGHVAAFRIAGHASARMVFIPLLGGIAIGGRPYDSQFEVAFSALMGAGLSAFLVPPAILASILAGSLGYGFASAGFAAFAGISALFNLGNLMPIWKFDGGQVLRQLFSEGPPLAMAAFTLLAVLGGIGLAAEMPGSVIAGCCAVIALLSFITSGQTVKPRRDLKPIAARERGAIAAALAAAIAIHGYGVVWAAGHFLG